jgi:hypothetical protein
VKRGRIAVAFARRRLARCSNFRSMSTYEGRQRVAFVEKGSSTRPTNYCHVISAIFRARMRRSHCMTRGRRGSFQLVRPIFVGPADAK